MYKQIVNAAHLVVKLIIMNLKMNIQIIIVI